MQMNYNAARLVLTRQYPKQIVNNAFTYKTTSQIFKNDYDSKTFEENGWRKYWLNINNSRYVYYDLLFREFIILTIW